jgi:hypothetical protein
MSCATDHVAWATLQVLAFQPSAIHLPLVTASFIEADAAPGPPMGTRAGAPELTTDAADATVQSTCSPPIE